METHDREGPDPQGGQDPGKDPQVPAQELADEIQAESTAQGAQEVQRIAVPFHVVHPEMGIQDGHHPAEDADEHEPDRNLVRPGPPADCQERQPHQPEGDTPDGVWEDLIEEKRADGQGDGYRNGPSFQPRQQKQQAFRDEQGQQEPNDTHIQVPPGSLGTVRICPEE